MRRTSREVRLSIRHGRTRGSSRARTSLPHSSCASTNDADDRVRDSDRRDPQDREAAFRGDGDRLDVTAPILFTTGFAWSSRDSVLESHGPADEFFAAKERLIRGTADPVFIDGKYDDHGKWMDGWESRRKRRTPAIRSRASFGWASLAMIHGVRRRYDASSPAIIRRRHFDRSLLPVTTTCPTTAGQRTGCQDGGSGWRCPSLHRGR